MMPRELFYWIQKSSESPLIVSVSRTRGLRLDIKTQRGLRLEDPGRRIRAARRRFDEGEKYKRAEILQDIFNFYQHYQPLTHEVVLVPVEPNELLESQVSDGLR